MSLQCFNYLGTAFLKITKCFDSIFNSISSTDELKTGYQSPIFQISIFHIHHHISAPFHGKIVNECLIVMKVTAKPMQLSWQGYSCCILIVVLDILIMLNESRVDFTLQFLQSETPQKIIFCTALKILLTLAFPRLLFLCPNAVSMSVNQPNV